MGLMAVSLGDVVSASATARLWKSPLATRVAPTSWAHHLAHCVF